MGKIIFFSIFGVLMIVLVAAGGSYLVVFWRDTRRRWRIENEQDERRRLRQSLEDIDVFSRDED